MLLVRAAGFHGHCWDQIVRHLPGQYIIAVEMRGHGRSDNTGPMTWKTLSHHLADLIAMPAESHISPTWAETRERVHAHLTD